MLATGKRVLLLLLTVCLSLSSFISAGALELLSEDLAQARVQAFAEETLNNGFDPTAPRKNKALRICDWYLHQDGFGFRIPEGYTLMLRYKGTTLTLVDESERGVAHRTGIVVRLTAEDNGLDKLTRKQLVNAYASQFRRFALRDFSHGTKFGVVCIRIAFVCDTAPQLLVQQYLFNKNGRGYVIALTMENKPERILRGLACFTEFADSLMFAAAAERRIVH